MNDQAARLLYDFETVIPDAIKVVFDAAGIACWTLSSDPEVQKDRPRVEVIYDHKGMAAPPRIAVLPDHTQRVSAYQGMLRVYVITDSDAPGKRAHSAFRAQVRAILASLPYVLNAGDNPPLARHAIHFPPISENEEHGIRQNDGFEQTTFTWNFNFSIQANAWAALTN